MFTKSIKSKSMLRVCSPFSVAMFFCVFVFFPSWQLRNRNRVDRTLLALPPSVRSEFIIGNDHVQFKILKRCSFKNSLKILVLKVLNFGIFSFEPWDQTLLQIEWSLSGIEFGLFSTVLDYFISSSYNNVGIQTFYSLYTFRVMMSLIH